MTNREKLLSELTDEELALKLYNSIYGCPCDYCIFPSKDKCGITPCLIGVTEWLKTDVEDDYLEEKLKGVMNLEET